MSRKLIKPDIKEMKRQVKKDIKRKPPPPYKTHAENYYYIKQMNHRTPMILELMNGEQIKGRIEWYDEKCLKVKKLDGSSNLIIFKTQIKYMYKDPQFAEERKEEKDERE